MAEFIAKPWGCKNSYPWRPLDSKEKRAAWSLKYYSMFKPGQHHKMLEQKEHDQS